MKFQKQILAIKARGRILSCEHDLKTLNEALGKIKLWKPALELKKQCDEILILIKNLEQRLERKLVITIIGPCGSGKSTMLNALAGIDDLAVSGHQRPTTRDIGVFCKNEEDAAEIINKIGEDSVNLIQNLKEGFLEHAILIDTPDTDSVEQDKHRPVLNKIISLSDILICVFDGENPKRLDHADFMAPYVQLFNGRSLIIVVNKCDRQSNVELSEIIMPEFANFIKKAWKKSLPNIFCVSARSNLNNPDWNVKAMPKHDLDQFSSLRAMVFDIFNQTGAGADIRLENARNLKDYIFNEVQQKVDKSREYLDNAALEIKQNQTMALEKALGSLGRENLRHLPGVNVLLYQMLAQRWLGPVGWIVAVWARILFFGAGFLSIFRFGNPFRQIWGLISSLINSKESRINIESTTKGVGLDTALQEYRITILKKWPDITNILVKGGFDSSVRQIDESVVNYREIGDDMTAIWSSGLEGEIEKVAQKLSGPVLQFIFNGPVLAILAYAGWLTADAFFKGQILSSDFFLHAFLTIIIILFLSFFILQGLIRLVAGKDKISKKAFSKVNNQLQTYQPLITGSINEQIALVLNLP